MGSEIGDLNIDDPDDNDNDDNDEWMMMMTRIVGARHSNYQIISDVFISKRIGWASLMSHWILLLWTRLLPFKYIDFKLSQLFLEFIYKYILVLEIPLQYFWSSPNLTLANFRYHHTVEESVESLRFVKLWHCRQVFWELDISQTYLRTRTLTLFFEKMEIVENAYNK